MGVAGMEAAGMETARVAAGMVVPQCVLGPSFPYLLLQTASYIYICMIFL